VRSVTVPKVNNALDKTTETVTLSKPPATNATELIQMLKAKVPPIMVRARECASRTSATSSAIQGDIKGTMANLNRPPARSRKSFPAFSTRSFVPGQGADDRRKHNTALEDIKEDGGQCAGHHRSGDRFW